MFCSLFQKSIHYCHLNILKKPGYSEVIIFKDNGIQKLQILFQNSILVKFQIKIQRDLRTLVFKQVKAKTSLT